MASGQISRRNRRIRIKNEQIRLDLCTYDKCKNKPKKNHSLCEEHLKYFRDRHRKKRAFEEKYLKVKTLK